MQFRFDLPVRKAELVWTAFNPSKPYLVFFMLVLNSTLASLILKRLLISGTKSSLQPSSRTIRT